MPQDLRCYRIFIASPGGLQDERKAFREVVREYNEEEAVPRGVLFWPVGWEDTLGRVGRPQSIINEDVRSCDYFLLLLWDRWGSPPDVRSSEFSSGTEEEYHVAMECFANPDQPLRQIVMIFKAVDAQKLSDPGPQLQQVLEFKARIECEKAHLFHTFDTVEQFQRLLRQHLAQWVRDHEGGTPKSATAGPAPPPTPEEPSVQVEQEPLLPSPNEGKILEAWSLADEGRLTEAEVAFSRAIVAGDDPRALLHYGRFLIRGGRVDQAQVMFERAQTISEQQGDQASLASASDSVGYVLYLRGDLEGAEQMYRKALEINRKLRRLDGMIRAYGLLGILLYVRGDWAGAEEMHRKALEINEMLERPEGMASHYSNLGNVLYARGDLDGAEQMHRKALEINGNLRRPEETAQIYNNLGNVLDARGDLDRAEQMYRKALEIEERLGRPEGMATIYLNLGNVLDARGDLDRAEQMYRKALEIEERLGRPEGMAKVYNNLGILLRVRSDLEAAEVMYRKALQINEKLGSLEGIAFAYFNLGNLLRLKNDLDAAEEMYEKALEICKQLRLIDRAAEVEAALISLRSSESKAT